MITLIVIQQETVQQAHAATGHAYYAWMQAIHAGTPTEDLRRAYIAALRHELDIAEAK